VAARRVAVVGGGWAGLASAVEATGRGAAVTLFDMARQWGGRARRVEVGGLPLDNGQHILIGAYTESLRLMRTVGVDIDAAFLRTPLRLATPDGRGLRLPSGRAMPAFVRGVVGQSAWSLRDRLSLLMAAGGWLAGGFRCDDDITVAQLCSRLPAAVRQDLLEPLCIAALNTAAETASARVFLRVLRDALFSGPGSADLLLPRVSLSDLLPEPAAAWLARSGAQLRPGRRVRSIGASGAGWRVDDEPFDAVIVACTAPEAARLVEPVAADWARSAAALAYEPIVTVYLQSEGTRLPLPMLALSCDPDRRPAQFVFDHGQLGRRAGLLAFVTSGAAPWLARGADATVDATMAQAREQLSGHLGPRLELVGVLTEKRATFRCTPRLARPAGAIARGLHAAGDYVAGPYPATLEGAVRSAIDAARAALSP
jgi:squalene-associated FAD-dependent desaturase